MHPNKQDKTHIKFNTYKTFKTTLLTIEQGDYITQQLVSILVLCASKLEINTISEMARLENKTLRGIKISNQYKKINIGKQTLAIKGVCEDSLPF